MIPFLFWTIENSYSMHVTTEKLKTFGRKRRCTWWVTVFYNDFNLVKNERICCSFQVRTKIMHMRVHSRYIIHVRASEIRMTWPYLKYDVIHTIRWENNFLIGIPWGAWLLDSLNLMWCHYSIQVVGIHLIAKSTKHLSRMFRLIANGAS